MRQAQIGIDWVAQARQAEPVRVGTSARIAVATCSFRLLIKFPCYRRNVQLRLRALRARQRPNRRATTYGAPSGQAGQRATRQCGQACRRNQCTVIAFLMATQRTSCSCVSLSARMVPADRSLFCAMALSSRATLAAVQLAGIIVPP